MTRGRLPRCLCVATVLLCGVTAVWGEPPGGARSIVLIFDASGSMAEQAEGGLRKIDQAKQALRRIVGDFAGLELDWAVVVCAGDTAELALPFTSSGQAVSTTIDQLSPGGKTPLRGSLELAIETLETQSRFPQGQIIILSDGMSTDGDPVPVAEELRAQYGGAAVQQQLISDRLLGVHRVYAATLMQLALSVVGFNVGQADEVAALKALATAGGGMYYSARNVGQLTTALRLALLRAGDSTQHELDSESALLWALFAILVAIDAGLGVGVWLYSQPQPGRLQPVACLLVTNGPDAGRKFPLLLGSTVLGRGGGGTRGLRDEAVSRRHATLEIAPGRITIVDQGSANGTWRRGRQLTVPTSIGTMDPFQLGRNTLEVHPLPSEWQN